VRVRHHELGSKLQVESSRLNGSQPAIFNLQPSTTSHLARIELGPSEIPRLLENDLFSAVADKLKAIGYAHVTLDLAGYRRGSMNESIAFRSAPALSRA
jgi:PP-loop superfamily ATP-utilizing enzyme